MSIDKSDLPYRPNVGAMLFNARGEVLMARRTDMPGAGGPVTEGVWQCPQGGIDDGETPRQAVMRELMEEIGTDHATIIGEYPQWISYDLPDHLIGKALGGQFRGQTQKWFALRFAGHDGDIRLDTHLPAEFDMWQWVPACDMSRLNVGFKRSVYDQIMQEFSRFAKPAGA